MVWFVVTSVQTGDSFDEFAVLVILTDTSPFEFFFTRLKAQNRNIIETAAAPVPMRDHFSVSVSEVVDGLMAFPGWMLVLMNMFFWCLSSLLQISDL